MNNQQKYGFSLKNFEIIKNHAGQIVDDEVCYTLSFDFDYKDVNKRSRTNIVIFKHNKDLVTNLENTSFIKNSETNESLIEFDNDLEEIYGEYKESIDSIICKDLEAYIKNLHLSFNDKKF